MATHNKNATVLLVDDEIDICDFLAEYVEERNLQPYYATDIKAALEIAKNHLIDLVFLDNNLISSTNGVEYIPEFKKINNQSKVYMLTANGQQEIRDRANKLGADGFIEKPFDFATLDSVLDGLSRKN